MTLQNIDHRLVDHQSYDLVTYIVKFDPETLRDDLRYDYCSDFRVVADGREASC